MQNSSITSTCHSFSIACGDKWKDKQTGEAFDVGVSKPMPSALAIAPGTEYQYPAEIFLSKHFATTPDVQ